MRIGSGRHCFEWVEGWADLPATDSVRDGWAHTGAAITAGGQVLTGHPGEPIVLVFEPDGRLARSFRTDLVELHGLHLDRDGRLWVADNGRKRVPESGYEYTRVGPGQVVALDLEGRVLTRLEPPDRPAYAERPYSPTGVATTGDGDVWVADGYGASLVHRYDRDGRLVQTLDGADGAGPFNCPHAVHVDTRRGELELYVADRASRRVQVFDLAGRFKRSFGEQFLSAPAAFAADGEELYVAEHLGARLTVLDRDDRPICTLGENAALRDAPGWPNQRAEDGRIVSTDRLQPGLFNSPHGLAVDARGDVYVAEWLIGGRYVKLSRA